MKYLKETEELPSDSNVSYLAVLCPSPRAEPMAAEEREEELA